MTTEQNAVQHALQEGNHISDVRRILLDQMRALRAAGADTVRQEIERSKGIAELAQAVTDTAKVEVDYIKATDQNYSTFLEAPADSPPPDDESSEGVPAQPRNGITSITRHRLR